nr:MAG TPA: hypothetical protein [Microviridae sp.]
MFLITEGCRQEQYGLTIGLIIHKGKGKKSRCARELFFLTVMQARAIWLNYRTNHTQR